MLNLKKGILGLTSGILALSLMASPIYAANISQSQETAISNQVNTATPIKHVVVIFSENVSFDHYFGTYPNASNLPGEAKFEAKPDTPSVNGLTQDLLTKNPNAAQPKRLAPSQAVTDDMDHDYGPEQKAFDGGKMDKFVENTGSGAGKEGWPFPNQDNSMVMNYYDGNTVTGLWNYAQHFAMSDNSFGTTYGPSTVGALNLIAGQTHGATGYKNGAAVGDIEDNVANGTVIGDPDPYFDKASNPKRAQVAMSGQNVGDLLNAKGLTWGWFEGGFRDPKVKHNNIAGVSSTDYNPHHEPFQYYKSTSNPDHLPPSSISMIGKTDQANHQYDMTDFWDAANVHNMPAVSYLKAPNYQDGHAGYSDPIDEQQFIVDTINRLQNTPEWKDTAVIISYDDSDGWYDHVYKAPVNGSNDPNNDFLFGPGNTGKPVLGNYLDRAGYGPRLPLLVVSPYAKENFVDHALTDQSSILSFIEDNWNLGRIGDHSYDEIAGSLKNMFDFSKNPREDKLFLDPKTGQLIKKANRETDIHGNWAETQMMKLQSDGILNGYPDGSVKPDRPMTRAEFTAILVKALHLPVQSGKVFTDTKNHWAKDIIGTAIANGIVKGVSKNQFSPDAPITREQMAVMVANAFKLGKGSGGKNFKDGSKMDSWAKNAVGEVSAKGIMAGYSDNTFKPKANATRAEAAAIILNALEK